MVCQGTTAAQGRREQCGSMSDGKGKGQGLAEGVTSLNKKRHKEIYD